MAEIHDGKPEHPELMELDDMLQRGQQLWIEGDPEIVTQHEQMTIYGPFGGPCRIVSGEGDPRQAAIRSQFLGGESKVEIVRTIQSGDLTVVVSLATCSVLFEGHEEPRPWILRVTEVYQHDGGQWIRLHRHADPLLRQRSLPDTLDLLSG